MLRFGIPEYRLPEKVLDWEIGNIASTQCQDPDQPEAGKEPEASSDLKDFDAVFISIGLEKSRRLMIPGETASGVISALDLLRTVNEGRKVSLWAKGCCDRGR